MHDFADTCSIARVDGHGRVRDQVLHQWTPERGDEYHRLNTLYTPTGLPLMVARGETSTPDGDPISSGGYINGRLLLRMFMYDSAGRRVLTSDPDSDSRNPSTPYTDRLWRYLYNEVGDLAAVRDPRGCGQNFYYDHAGRLIAEDYVGCGEALACRGHLGHDAVLPAGAIGMDENVGVATPIRRRALLLRRGAGLRRGLHRRDPLGDPPLGRPFLGQRRTERNGPSCTTTIEGSSVERSACARWPSCPRRARSPRPDRDRRRQPDSHRPSPPCPHAGTRAMGRRASPTMVETRVRLPRPRRVRMQSTRRTRIGATLGGTGDHALGVEGRILYNQIGLPQSNRCGTSTTERSRRCSRRRILR